MKISQSRVRELFEYTESGDLLWRVTRSHNAKAGAIAGYVKENGYRYISIDSRRYLAHRLVFLYHHGYLPPQVDHINTVRLDNRIENLRAATSSQNKHNSRRRSNNTSGVKGVSWCKRKRRWRTSICVRYQQVHVGYFSTLEEAAAAYGEAAERLHGEYARLD